VQPTRFGIYQYQHLSLPDLRARWRRADEVGFDVLWNVDSLRDPDRERSPMLDGPATLVAMAEATTRIRIGTLVTSMYFRHPVLAARAAITVDHLSGGRVEVALGVGDPSVGPAAVGVDPGQPGDRVARFREYVEVVDLVLRQDVTTYHGRHFRSEDAESFPGPVQQPRPPITVGAHGPKMLRIAARVADGWSQWGGYDVDTAERFERVTLERCRRFDDLCAELGRDPSGIRHQLVCFPPLRPWASVEAFLDLVGRFTRMGVDDFVLYWPRRWDDDPHEDAVFEEVCSTALAGLREVDAHPVTERRKASTPPAASRPDTIAPSM
jgi:alkanesulfonate monooxygenase SsuD/methylene tetrahydromethanopterin reductase-like flavin-dependent oxidoreductase (luciferase family)